MPPQQQQQQESDAAGPTPAAATTAPAPRLLIVDPSRVALVRRLLGGPRKSGRLAVQCLLCPRAYHTACATPDVAVNVCAAHCDVDAAVPLPGDGEDDSGGAAGLLASLLERDAAAMDDGGEGEGEGEAEATARRGRGRRGGGKGPVVDPAASSAEAALRAARCAVSAAAKLRPLAVAPTAPLAGARDDWRHFRLPASILSDAASKPPPYVHIVKNVYTIRVKPRWPDSEACACGASMGAGGSGSSGRGGGSSSESRGLGGAAASGSGSAAVDPQGRTATCGESCVNRLLRIECRCVYPYSMMMRWR